MKKTKNKHRNLRRRNAITGYLFILPFIIGFLVFLLKPLFESLQMSLHKVTVATGKGGRGFSLDPIKTWKESNYYKALFVETEFKNRLMETLPDMAIQIPAVLVFSFFIALILNQEFKGRGFVRAIFFIPVILSSGVIVGLDTNNSLMGGMKDMIAEAGDSINISATLETILRATGIGNKILEPVFEIINGVDKIVLASGIQIVIFISGLQTVTPSMYEAAKVEGCTAWESFWKITFPLVSSMILVNLVYTVVDFLMRTDNRVMEIITQYSSATGMKYDIGAAMAWTYFGIVAVVLAILAAIISKKVYYYE